jgi:anti-sigma factor RsiW
VTYAEGGQGGVGPDYNQGGWRRAGVETAELTHEAVRSQLSDYLSGELSDEERVRIRGHLTQCAACAADLATLSGTVGLLGGLPGRTAPDSLRRRLLAIPDDEPDPAC